MQRKTIILLALVVLIVAVGFILLLQPGSETAPETVQSNEMSTTPYSGDNEPISATPSDPEETDFAADLKRKIREKLITKEEAFEQLFRNPLAFHGRVLDLEDNPIEGATVTIGVVNNLEGGTDHETTTDAEGNFSISNIFGIGLHVRVAKDGYYKLDTTEEHEGSNRNFDRSPLTQRDDSNEGTRSNPAIFRLKKMGETEPLIYITDNVKLLPTNRSLSLKSIDSNAPPIQISFWREQVERGPGELRYDWTFSFEVPGGELAQRECKFGFTAPEEGYQSGYEIQMEQSVGDNWQKNVRDELFIKFNDGTYGLIKFKVAAGSQMFRYQYYYNPSGSQNLEYDPTKRINP